MDENTKRRFDAFCADAGMNASVAVSMFVRAVIREKGGLSKIKDRIIDEIALI